MHLHKICLSLKQIEHPHFSQSSYMPITTAHNQDSDDLAYDVQLENEFKTFNRWMGERAAIFEDLAFEKAFEMESLSKKVEWPKINKAGGLVIQVVKKHFLKKRHSQK